MKLAQTFQAVEETRFLSKLSLTDYLLFVGEAEPLEYIQKFMGQSKPIDHNYYLAVSEQNLANFEANLSNWYLYQAIIIVSWQQEDQLLSQIKERLIPLQIKLPIVRLFADVFVNLICQRQLFQPTVDTLVKPKTSYAIITTPRSGSTHFCDLLNSTDVLGYPTEHLRFAAQELALNCNFNYLRFLHNLMQYRITGNEVFGTKIISHFLFEFKKTQFPLAKVFQSIDKFILLIRRDKVAQAVSLVVAQKTDVWHIKNNIRQDNQNYQAYRSQLENITIDDALLAEVAQKQKFIQNQEQRLRKILANHQKTPLEIFYEDIVKDPQGEINRVLNFLAITTPPGYSFQLNSQVAKMPASISQEIIRQYQQRQQQLTPKSN